MLEKITSFVVDKEFRLTLYDDKLHIINYREILSLTDDSLIVSTLKGKIFITGNNLTFLKLVEKEVLIAGKIKNIEVDFHD